ncbi:MAG: FkbM family methyltransferase, partial [Synergistaceae bacterium]|nr:FkbM family methyltransferase [Synergistaceae bacterium]
FSPVDDEIVVDAGAYDGATAIQFLKWGGGKVRHVYSFEFDPDNAAKCRENIRPYSGKVTLVEKGTWDKDKILRINTPGTSGSSVRSKGSTAVYLTTIDSIVKDERVTFIKMDVEGAELKSLMGARNTIIKNHPRLAVCVYHKPTDLCDIPGYILSLVPDYKFFLRHYSSCQFETVLYAYCE